ncbi:winged helix-turn-helix domain-containing protein [Streptomyces sp. NPDC001177]
MCADTARTGRLKRPVGLPKRVRPGRITRDDAAAGRAAIAGLRQVRLHLARPLVGRRCDSAAVRTPCPLQPVQRLLRRTDWSVQVPQRRAAERDENAVATWIKKKWPGVERRWGARTRGCASRTSRGSRRGQKARTSSWRPHAPCHRPGCGVGTYRAGRSTAGPAAHPACLPHAGAPQVQARQEGFKRRGSSRR